MRFGDFTGSHPAMKCQKGPRIVSFGGSNERTGGGNDKDVHSQYKPILEKCNMGLAEVFLCDE
jgi:hypothetical protein